MPRPPRVAPAGFVFHALNRARAGQSIFEHPGDYSMFERVLVEAKKRVPVRLFAYCIMPNHWHLVLQPETDDALARFMARLTQIHAQRWLSSRQAVGAGHLYQGRYKAFPVETDDHFLTVCRYVERNPLRAGLVRRAEAWRWGSLWRREEEASLLDRWPLARPEGWRTWVNQPEGAGELAALRAAVERGRPFGHRRWVESMAARLGLISSLRSRGRPEGRKKGSDPFSAAAADPMKTEGRPKKGV